MRPSALLQGQGCYWRFKGANFWFYARPEYLSSGLWRMCYSVWTSDGPIVDEDEIEVKKA